MPTYRQGRGWVHLKMARGKGPAPCVARMQTDGRWHRCCAMSTKLCDFPTAEGGTCDAPLCDEHAVEVGPDRHLCPIHADKKP